MAVQVAVALTLLAGAVLPGWLREAGRFFVRVLAAQAVMPTELEDELAVGPPICPRCICHKCSCVCPHCTRAEGGARADLTLHRAASC